MARMLAPPAMTAGSRTSSNPAGRRDAVLIGVAAQGDVGRSAGNQGQLVEDDLEAEPLVEGDVGPV